MGKDGIFGDLGETISRTAKVIGEKADDLLELQKLSGRAAGERRQVQRKMEALGDLIYHRHVDGVQMDLEVSDLCDEITKRKMMLARYEEEIAKRKGHKVCPACGQVIRSDSAFCSYCGARSEQERPSTEKTGTSGGDSDVQGAGESRDQVQQDEDTQGGLGSAEVQGEEMPQGAKSPEGVQDVQTPQPAQAEEDAKEPAGTEDQEQL